MVWSYGLFVIAWAVLCAHRRNCSRFLAEIAIHPNIVSFWRQLDVTSCVRFSAVSLLHLHADARAIAVSMHASAQVAHKLSHMLLCCNHIATVATCAQQNGTCSQSSAPAKFTCMFHAWPHSPSFYTLKSSYFQMVETLEYQQFRTVLNFHGSLPKDFTKFASESADCLVCEHVCIASCTCSICIQADTHVDRNQTMY